MKKILKRKIKKELRKKNDKRLRLADKKTDDILCEKYGIKIDDFWRL